MKPLYGNPLSIWKAETIHAPFPPSKASTYNIPVPICKGPFLNLSYSCVPISHWGFFNIFKLPWKRNEKHITFV